MNKPKYDLQWRHLKALHDLFTKGKTKSKITDNFFVSNYLINQKKIIRFQFGNHNFLIAQPSFQSFYKENFKDDFEHYYDFLKTSGLDHDARKRYSEYDIRTLIFIHENKEQLKSALTTERTFSSQVFKEKGSKYLKTKPGLKQAVCQLLDILDFPDKDPKNNQVRLVVDCLNPKVIVLCENLNNLKMPWQTRKLGIELWYVGGNNISIVDEIPNKYLDLPIYYLCDWDYEGLKIFCRVNNKLKIKNKFLLLLEPLKTSTPLPTKSENHKSEWKKDKNFSGLDINYFTNSQICLINYLIENEFWIEEESLDLIELLKEQKII